MTLYDKDLTEIKQQLNGEWQLLGGVGPVQSCEYDDTFIVFDDDRYEWIEEDTREPGEMNWRKEKTCNGYESYMMDVFYSDLPAYPLALRGDTLLLQDCSPTLYRYTLVRTKIKGRNKMPIVEPSAE